jgi:xylan 1,4-beta-xylosidase
VPPKGKTDQIIYKQDLPPIDKGKLTVELTNVTNGRYKLSIYQIGYKHNDPYTAYVAMGMPGQITRKQVTELSQLSSGAPIELGEVDVSDGRFEKSLPLKTNDCY